MKGIIKTGIMIGALALLGACSGKYVEIAERDTYAQPKWYANCAETGTEGWFWWKEDYAYACGAGVSVFEQAAEEQMYAIAMNHFAKRINGEVNSETVIDIKDNSKTILQALLTLNFFHVSALKYIPHICICIFDFILYL